MADTLGLREELCCIKKVERLHRVPPLDKELQAASHAGRDRISLSQG